MAFHVFVEGATDGTPAGVERLANAIARHYGLPAEELLARLQKGRFRVKGNVDRALADKYRRDLERLGARCVIEAATAENSARATPLPFPAVRPATPPAGVPEAGSPSTPSPLGDAAPSRPTPPPSALAGVAPSRPTPPPSALAGVAPSRPTPPPSALAGVAPSRPTPPPSALAGVASKAAAAQAPGTSQYQSGLAAAFAPGDAPASLGALDSDGGSFSLASVDGAEEQAPSSAGAFEPAASTMSASIGPPPDNAKTPAKSDKSDRPKDVPLDLFAPPDARDAELAVDLAADEPPRRKSEPAIPVPADVASASEPATRRSQPSLHAHAGPATVAPASSKLGPLADLRVRFAAGVLLALLVGFVPAHVIASVREDGYRAIDNKVIAAQQLADTPDAYVQLDQLRADQLERKRGEQRNTAIIALAIWGLVGGAVAFGWFKKIPWERYE
jgi:hypothetical protein